MLAQLVSVYVTVLGAEIVGDKTLYTVGSLAARHRAAAVVAGAAAAAALKMAAAAYFGQVLARMPPLALALLSAVTFAGIAASAWRKGARAADAGPPPDRSPARTAAVAFAAVILTEWADPGQVAAALLSARYRAPALVTAGATVAMCTKIVVGVTVGRTLRRRVPETALRVFTTAVLVIMAALAAFQVEL